jgi:hypothetical protein
MYAVALSARRPAAALAAMAVALMVGLAANLPASANPAGVKTYPAATNAHATVAPEHRGPQNLQPAGPPGQSTPASPPPPPCVAGLLGSLGCTVSAVLNGLLEGATGTVGSVAATAGNTVATPLGHLVEGVVQGVQNLVVPPTPNTPASPVRRRPEATTSTTTSTVEGAVGAPKPSTMPPRQQSVSQQPLTTPRVAAPVATRPATSLAPNHVVPRTSTPAESHHAISTNKPWPRGVLDAATKLTVPILFGVAVAVFLLVQALIDRKDPKIVSAPRKSADDTVGFR